MSSIQYYVGNLTNVIIFAHHHNSILFWSNFGASFVFISRSQLNLWLKVELQL